MKKDKLTIAIIIVSIGILLTIGILIFLNVRDKNEKKVQNQKTEATEKKDKSTKEANQLETNTLFLDQTPATSEVEVVAYIDEVNQEVEALTSKQELTPSIKEKLTNTFITLTDFVFYGGTIKGKTFHELSTSAKEKVISTLETLDSKIETVAPNYKETIKETTVKSYTTVKEKAKSLKDSIVANYKEKVGEEQYNQVVDTYEEDKNRIKEAYSPVIDKGKEVYEKAKDKGKEIYGSTKEKANSWYQKFKESRN